MSKGHRKSRAHSAPRLRKRSPYPVIAWVIAAAAILGVVATAVGLSALASPRAQAEPVAVPSPPDVSVQQTQTVAPSRVEVPPLSGLSLTEAETVLSAADLAIRVRSEGSLSEHGVLLVVDQEPAAGVLTDASSSITVTVRSVEPTATEATEKPDEDAAPEYVVCIDPGHQARADATPEPVGPGSKTVKPSVSGGATGVKTRVPEYEIAMQISMNLKQELEARGVKVVMTRTTNDVNLSNSERAMIANRAEADLLIRIHGDGSPEASTAGLSTLYPAKNKWTSPVASDSQRAARLIQSAAIGATGAVDRGIKQRGDLTGFNWSEVPSVLVECGFLSNPVEDRLLASPHYQDKLARGIADGALRFLGESR